MEINKQLIELELVNKLRLFCYMKKSKEKMNYGKKIYYYVQGICFE